MHEETGLGTYLLICLAGGLGGGGAVAFHYLRHRRMPWGMFAAYLVAGAVIGLVVGAWLLVLDANGVLIITEDWLVAVCTTSGMLSTACLLILQSIAAVALRWKGVEVAVTFTRSDRQGRSGGA